MTQTELEQLSRDVAAKRGCEPYKKDIEHFVENFDGDLVQVDYKDIWLTDDSAFCFELMVSEKLQPQFGLVAVYIGTPINTYRFADHTDENQATRVAILKAYLAKGE